MAKILMIVAPEGFRDEECFVPKKVFEENKAEVTIASKDVKEAKGKLGGKIKVDMDISDAEVNDYDAIVFIGGPGAAAYFEDDIAQAIAKEAYDSGKVVAAICIAPSILANAGILKGKKATVYPSEEENLKDKGAEYTGESLTIDGKIITANGPDAAEDFAKEIVCAV
ncbi:DJ-1/PfpI family protein [Candidatus Woesearchaeota archaeon]|nr:DJ-1/PfpI family protein [Candidatus Woesearchaeota archaeon]